MFANTLSITIGTDSARVLTRVNQDDYSSVYRLASATEFCELVIRNSTASESGRVYDRHNAELRLTTYASADGSTPETHYVASNTFRTRRTGGDPARLVDVTKAMNTLVSTSLVTGMSQGES